MALIRALALVIAVLILAVPVELPGCGWAPPSALFVLQNQPEDPAGDLARGKLGVLQRSYEREHLVVAYRFLIGSGLNEKERAAIFSKGESPGDMSTWNEARAKVPVPAGGTINAYRPVGEPGYLALTLNCGTDAFRTAARTLADRSQKLGLSSPLLQDWVLAQDMVFSNCGGGSSIPKPTDEPQLRSDRDYQIAAAKFYARRFQEAGEDFERIAHDRGSPWRISAPYLAARCLIRNGKLAEADGGLARIVSDPALSEWHQRAQRLRNYIALQTRPAERLRELGHALVIPNSEETIGQDLIDYSFPSLDEAQRPREDDLSDWIATFQAGDRKHAVEKWHATHSIPWLVAALQDAVRTDPDIPALLKAVREVAPGTPAYVMLSYDSLRLLPAQEARAKASALLRMDLPVSARNLILSERMRLARNFDEFLRYALRQPVGSSGIDGEVPEQDAGRYLGDDSAYILNAGVPLALMKQASESKTLPAKIRKELAFTVFARSVILSDPPDFDGILTLLRSPGISPWVRSGYGRRVYTFDSVPGFLDNVPTRIENYRDNWWQANQAPGNVPIHLPAFLSESERRAASDEWKKLRRLPTGVNWLGTQTLTFAAAHPEDLRVPEALHRVVKATRYSVTDEASGELSRRAFVLLHQRYPKTEWARKTPYWFE